MIFGKGFAYVKIVDTDIEFELFYTGIFPESENNKILSNISPITGERDYVDLWNLVDYKLRVYLFRHDSPTDYYNLISRLRDSKFYLKQHKFESDGVTPSAYIKDNDNELMEFKCVKFTPFYLNNINKFDVVDLEIEGVTPGRVEVAFPCGMPFIRNSEMNNLLSTSTGTPILVTGINTANNTITLSWMPYIASIVSPTSGKEWALLNTINNTGGVDPAVVGDYSDILKIASGDYATKTLTYTVALGAEVNWDIGDKVMLYNPFEAKWDWKVDPLMEESGVGWRSDYVAPSGIFQKKDGTYVMLVTGKSKTGVRSVGAFSASSLSAETWTVMNSDAAIFAFGDSPWCSNAISMYQVSKLKDEDRYIAYVAGENAAGKWNIGWVKFAEDFTDIKWSPTEIVDSSDYADGFTAASVIEYNGGYRLVCVGRSADLTTEAWKAIEFYGDSQDGTFTAPSVIIDGLSTNDGIFNSSHTDMFCHFKYNNKLYCIIGGTSRYLSSGSRGNRVYGLMLWDESLNTPAWVIDSRSPVLINPLSGSYIWGASYLWSQDHLGGAPTMFYDKANEKLYLYLAANNGSDSYKVCQLTIDIADTIIVR